MLTDDIHSVEMIGDATRTPILLDITKQIFGKTELNRTLNSLECIGRGASLQAAMLSPLFSVSSFSVEEYNSLPVSITYQFGGDGKVVTKEIFPRGSSFPSTKTITFDNKFGNMDLLVHYSKGTAILPGLPDQIAQYMIKEGKLKHEDAVGGSKAKFVLRVSNNIHQIPCLEGTDLEESWTEEEKIVIKKPAAAKPAETKAEAPKEGEQPAEEKPAEPAPATEQDYEIKQKKKSTATPIAFDTQAHSLPPAVRQQFAKLEEQLRHEDARFLDWKEARNDLEAYSYDMRNNLDSYGNYEKYCEESVKGSFVKNINEVVDWLYGAGETAALAEYQQKLNDFRTLGEPIKARYRFHSTAPDFFVQFDATVKKVLDKQAELEHLTEDQRKIIGDKIAVASEYIGKIKADIAAKKLWEDVPYTVADIERQIALLKSETTAIFNQPPPKPKAEEKPEADKPAEEAPKEEAAGDKPDVEMSEGAEAQPEENKA